MTSYKISYFLSLIAGVDMDQKKWKLEHGGVCYVQKKIPKSTP